MALTRLQLQNQAQRSNESFKEYAQRWREIASRVRPALSDNKVVDIFMGTLQGLYYEKMIDSSSTNLIDMVTIREHVENGLKSGKITNTTAPRTTNKRLHGGFAKKKKGEANVVTPSARPQYQFLMAPIPYYLYPYVAAAQYQQPHSNTNHRKSDKILVPYAELVPYLFHVGAIIPKEIPAATHPFLPKHDPNASCAYHAGFIGNSTKDCWALKYKIQDLINQEIPAFSEEKPNVKTNPLPNHGGAAANAVVEEETNESILRDEEVKTLMSVMLQRLEKFDGCDKSRVYVQELIDQGLMQFSKSKAAEEMVVIEPITIVYRKKKVEAPSKRIQPIHFRVPSLFPYQNTKAVPWNYETTTYLRGKEICIPDTEIVNIAGAGGMTAVAVYSL
ncbi:uncharacterized protein LOC127137454 [Lathyrus oleraceus]|uniref:uncharacterized protein LOC127137454 n=1 Tax=Pisum sativum TaxID=3888 RepID=UPI0021CFA1AC|nr:uncharacterized protein LOC127137454 [Pisum sativum]